MRIAILGRTSLLYSAMELLVLHGHEIVLIGTCKAAAEYQVTEVDFELYAKKNNIPFFCNSKLESTTVLSLIKKVKADIAVSVNWINIIREPVISCFKYGILNAHAGDLPRYRGNACPNWAIICGESRIGLTVHFMEAGELDSGKILVKEFYDLNKSTRIGDIYDWMGLTIPKMFLKAICGLDDGTIIPKSQSNDIADSLRVYPRKCTDSLINWNKSAEEIERIVNASSEPFAGAYTWYNMKKMIIWRAYSTEWDCPSIAIPGQVIKRNDTNGQVDIACGKGILRLVEISLEDEKMHPCIAITSLRDRLGMNVEDEIYLLYKKMNS